MMCWGLMQLCCRETTLKRCHLNSGEMFVSQNTTAKGDFLVFMSLNENDETDFYKSHYNPIAKTLASKRITKIIAQGNYRWLSYILFL